MTVAELREILERMLRVAMIVALRKAEQRLRAEAQREER